MSGGSWWHSCEIRQAKDGRQDTEGERHGCDESDASGGGDGTPETRGADRAHHSTRSTSRKLSGIMRTRINSRSLSIFAFRLATFRLAMRFIEQQVHEVNITS